MLGDVDCHPPALFGNVSRQLIELSAFAFSNVPAISRHLSNIFADGELEKNSVVSILETTAADGKNYNTQYYNLDAIIAVGYRVNSIKARRPSSR